MSASGMFAMRRNVVVAASAGTGKTFHLVGALVHLLVGQSELCKGGVAIDASRVVATTFSRKAAAEIRERLVVELERLSGDPASSPYRDGLLGLDDRTLSSRARVALASADRAQITTLHGLAHRLARLHALELGYGADFTLAEDDESARITRDAVLEAASRFADAKPAEIEPLLSLFKGADRLVDGVIRVLSQLEEMGVSASAMALPEGDREAIEDEMREVIEATRALASEPGFDAAARAVGRAWDARDDLAVVTALLPLFTMRRTKGAPNAAHVLWDLRDDLPGSSNAARASALVARFSSRATAGETTRRAARS